MTNVQQSFPSAQCTILRDGLCSDKAYVNSVMAAVAALRQEQRTSH